MEKSFRDPASQAMYKLYVLDDADNRVLIAFNGDLNLILGLAKNLWDLSENDYWIYLERENGNSVPLVKFFA